MQRWLENGYVVVVENDLPRFEHHLVAEKVLGRALFPHEEIRHKNGVRSDNRIPNLELVRVFPLENGHPQGFSQGVNPRSVYDNHKERGKKTFSYTYEDLAQLLNMDEGAVRVAVHRKQFDPAQLLSVFNYKEHRKSVTEKIDRLYELSVPFRR